MVLNNVLFCCLMGSINIEGAKTAQTVLCLEINLKNWQEREKTADEITEFSLWQLFGSDSVSCLYLYSVLISPSQSSEHSLNYIPNIQTVQIILQSYIVPFLRILRTFTLIVSLFLTRSLFCTPECFLISTRVTEGHGVPLYLLYTRREACISDACLHY